MNRHVFLFLMAVLLAMAVATCCLAAPMSEDAVTTGRQSSPATDRAAFAEAVDLSPFDRLAVHTDGRLKSFESFVRGELQHITGSRTINDQSPGFTYLDLMIRPEAYADVDVIFVKNKQVRARIADALGASPMARARPGIDSRIQRMIKTGLIAESDLKDPWVSSALDSMRDDLVRTAKYVEMIEWAMHARQPDRLARLLRIVPPSRGGFEDRWLSMRDITSAEPDGPAAELDDAVRDQLAGQWTVLVEGWRKGDASMVNAAAAALAELLPAVNEELYPSQTRLAWESWYFKARNMTWVWIVYALSIVPLLLAIIHRWRAAGWVGMSLFTIAFALHTCAIMLRWYVAARWPNSNMFEAVTTSAWFGGCFAIVLEPLLRRTPVRNMLALCSAVGSMVALMSAHFMPLQLNPNISNMMPVLHDVWLYIHVNVIIFAYALIFMAAVPALLYVLARIVGYGSSRDYAKVGGIASLISTSRGGEGEPAEETAGLGRVLDGVTMVLMELSFILLWAGIVMGAIWADHSWGRPWGWDPKEVFALNTFLVYAALIHIRLKVKDKGLWTAILAIFGCGVMLFNWIIINFHLVGLHSYA